MKKKIVLNQKHGVAHSTDKISKKKKKQENRKLKLLIEEAKNISKKNKLSVSDEFLPKRKMTEFEDEEKSSEVVKSSDTEEKMQPMYSEVPSKKHKSTTLKLEKGQCITLRGMCILKCISGCLEINCYQATPGSIFKMICPNYGCMQINLRAVKETSFQISPLERRVCDVFRALSLYNTLQNLFIEHEKFTWTTDSDVYVTIDNRIENFVTEALGKSSKSYRSKICVCGTKNSGKSTTSLFIVNLLLCIISEPRVLWLDVDVGQPEFSLPGSVSLLELTEPVFGPNFCHLRKPVRSIFVGCVNIVDALVIYLNAIESLINYVDENYSKSIPIVFNMPGWLEVGLGFEITSNLMRILQPSHTVQFLVNGTNVVEMKPETVSSACNLRPGSNLKAVDYDLLIIDLDSPRKNAKTQNASKERQIRCIVHFNEMFANISPSVNHIQHTCVMDFPRKPVSLIGKVLEVFPTNSSLNPKLILMAFNMSIVAFCNLQANETFFEPIAVNNSEFCVANEKCQKRSKRIVLGYGIVAGEWGGGGGEYCFLILFKNVIFKLFYWI